METPLLPTSPQGATVSQTASESNLSVCLKTLSKLCFDSADTASAGPDRKHRSFVDVDVVVSRDPL
jgi:hypothetical protein